MWWKLLLGLSPAAAVIAWLTYSQMEDTKARQNISDTKIEKESLKFQEKANMFNAYMFGAIDRNQTGQFYKKKAEEAKKTLVAIKEKEEREKRAIEESRKRIEKQLADMDQGIEDVNWNERKIDKQANKPFSESDLDNL